MKTVLGILKIFSTIIFYAGVYGLKDVTLTLEPEVVERSHSCILKCTYDLEGAPLYTVKWYRGFKEFYRYTPKDNPSTKVFETPGINVDVDQSNITQVVIQDVDFSVAGNFSCEVTIEEDFLTGVDMQLMKVVQLPERAPAIKVTTDPLDYGDKLSASCMSPPSIPPAMLKFVLNNRTVARTDPLVIAKMPATLSWSDLFLNITLTEEHFSAGRLILKCEAHINNVYRESAELNLNTVRGPVPERVYDSSASLIYSTSVLQLIMIIINYTTVLIYL